jgi:hypothetical protein
VPFTKEPLDYPLNRLLLRVGIALQSWLLHQPPARNTADRERITRVIAEYFDLDQAIEDGLLRGYKVRFDRHGCISTIHLIPADKVRRTPGIKMLRKLFFERRR